MIPVYYVPANDILPIPFDTFDGGTGASITMTGIAVTDIEIYKDVSMTQRASDNGYTLTDTDGIDLDGITGIQGVSIDLSDNSDASFYTVGAWFRVVISSITVDGQTVNFTAAVFRIMAAEDAAGVPDVNVTHYGGSAGTFSGGRPEVNASHAGGTAWGSGAITAGSIAASALNGKGDWALATVLGALADAAADGDPTTADTVMQYIKQLVNTLVGTAGIPTFPTGAAPGNAVSLAEAIRHIFDQIGTAGVALTEAGGTGDQFTAVPWNAAWDAEVESEVDDALGGGTGTALTSIPWNAAWDAEVQSEVDDALVARFLDKLVVASGTSDSGTTTTMVDAARTEANDYWIGSVLVFTSGALSGQARLITDFVASSDTMTFYPAATQAVGTETYVILPGGLEYLRYATETQLPAIATSVGNISNNLGAIDDAAADGNPTNIDTAMAYIKQLVNTLVGSAGIPTWDAGAAPGNGVSMAEAIRYIYEQIGVAGAGLTTADDATLAAIAALNNLSSAQAQTAAAAALTAYDPPTRAEATADKDEILTQLPAAPVKNAAFTYVIKMVDATDHATPETGLTITMTRSIDGAAFGAATGAVTEISTGHYRVAASAADMNGDVVTHKFAATGADDLTIVMKTVS